MALPWGMKPRILLVETRSRDISCQRQRGRQVRGTDTWLRHIATADLGRGQSWVGGGFRCLLRCHGRLPSVVHRRCGRASARPRRLEAFGTASEGPSRPYRGPCSTGAGAGHGPRRGQGRIASVAPTRRSRGVGNADTSRGRAPGHADIGRSVPIADILRDQIPHSLRLRVSRHVHRLWAPGRIFVTT